MAFGWQCPFCGHWATITGENVDVFRNRFNIDNRYGALVLAARLIACPNPECREIQLKLTLGKSNIPNHLVNHPQYLTTNDIMREWNLIPSSRAKPMADFVPASIVEDYEEACAIETSSPKASATLARRCVQQILRDFFEVKPGRLFDEIGEIKGKVAPAIWDAIDDLRAVGNIGAHPEADINLIIDVDPEEAAALISLIELLIEETYVTRDRQEKALASVRAVAASKKALKATAPPTALPPSGSTATKP